MKSLSSLSYRLSLWLVLQSFAGLAAVCGVVYAATAYTLEIRQKELLDQKALQVKHLLSEQASDIDRDMLRHKLDDFLVGHQNLWLSLSLPNGRMQYEKQSGPPPSDRLKTLVFAMSALPWSSTPVLATLTLDTREDQRLLHRFAFILLMAALGGVALISVGGFFLVRMGLRPVRHLAEQTALLAADTLHHRLDGSNQPTELAPLVTQFNEMLRRLELAYEQLESFNADVAHELCTPLSTLIASTELALRRQRDQEELREVLGANLEDLQRMAAIVRDMLFLSRADRGVLARREWVDSLASIASEVGDYHEAAITDAGLTLQILGDAAGSFDVGLIKRAISNLLGNATRYANQGSTVVVKISTEKEAVQLFVINQGERIPPDDLERIFDRFFRVDPSRSDAPTNHGLGLAIVSAIARMHGGHSIANSGTNFTSIGLHMTALENSHVNAKRH